MVLFSVIQSDADAVIRYIESQKEHNRKRTFHEEYRKFLEGYQILYYERHVWD